MTFDEIAEILAFSPGVKCNFQIRWEKSEATFHPDSMEFLSENFIRTYFPALTLEPEILPLLLNTAERIRTNSVLFRFAWHLYYRTFLDPDGAVWMPMYDPPESLAGEYPGLFNLLLALSSVPLINRTYQNNGMPKESAMRHHTWIRGTVEIYKAAHGGKPGHSLNQLAWLRLAVDGKLFRIGRLEYVVESGYPQWIPAIYKNIHNDRIAALARPGWKYDAAGHRIPENASGAAIVAFLREDADKIEGIHLRYDGTIDRNTPYSLSRNDWQPLVSPWDVIVSMHIPGGGGMTPEAVKDSFGQAVEFFRTYFHRHIPLVVCSSWILNPEWRTLLPDSNLAKFQKSVFQLESPVGGGRDGLFFLFGRDDGNPLEEYPADNSARRAMLQVLREGRPLKSGAMFFPTIRLSSYGHPEDFCV